MGNLISNKKTNQRTLYSPLTGSLSFVTLLLCLLSNFSAKAESFVVSAAKISFCNQHEIQGKEVVFGAPHLLLSDYINNSNVSTYKGLDATGMRFPASNSANKHHEDFFVNGLLTLRVQGDPITLDEYNQKLRYCIVLQDEKGRTALLDTWKPVVLAHVSRTLLNFYKFTGKKTEYERKNSTLIETISSGKGIKVLVEYNFEEPGMLNAIFYSVATAKRSINKHIGTRWDLKVIDDHGRKPLDVGMFSYSNDKLSSTPVSVSDLTVFRFDYSWSREKSFANNLKDFVWEAKKIANSVDTMTTAQLKVDAVESRLIAENPHFVEEMYCRLMLKGGDEKCKEHMKYRMPLAPIIDSDWDRDVDYKYWLAIAKTALNRHGMNHIQIDQILLKEIPFYNQPKKRRYLVEVSDSNEVTGKYYFLSTGSSDLSWWLDGTANPIIQHNRDYGLLINSPEQALQYLKFFNSSISLSGAPVYVLDLENNRFPGLQKGDVEPPKIINSSEHVWEFLAFVVLGPTYGSFKFTVTKNGAVSMGDQVTGGWLKGSDVLLDRLVLVNSKGLRKWSEYDVFMREFNVK